ncbi:Ger(x)C family spore germination protein [Bacillus sp. ISL-35]|uniref:Ger(x)C family spore germination protein n=1 Tax=Bacillus sp. ISL-35 TaxID=2819122 RepID=UPI001BEA462C|nr:Ger(x)C family spore germination protein [Bacillus sp. ISL-35]MBT2678883.1 Ger(x)C family spore germination protein [Bacillus sp. ISL-35]MBT2703875.1 Ger(x)C family spore germination protein [Chryseobacterium sp. ISL-80]
MLRKTWSRISVLLISAFLTTGCADPKTLERMGLITTVGYDVTEDGELQTTFVMLQIDPNAPQNSVVLTTKALTSKGARIEADLKSPKKLQSGQLRVALFSEEVVKLGLINLADTLSRDPSISDLTYLAVVEGNTKKLLDQKNSKFADISQMIYKQLDQNTKGETVPSSTLQETMHDYYAPGVDPSMPLIKDRGGEIVITGMALISDDKMVGKINPEEAFFLKLINDRYKAGSIELTVSPDGLHYTKAVEGPDELAVVLDTINSKTDIKLIDKDTPKFELKITLKTRLLEVNQALDLKSPDSLKQLEKKLSGKIKSDIEGLITKAQELNSDPFGFGEIYRKNVRHSNLTTKSWHEIYPDSKVDVKIKFEILRTGVVE